MFLSTLSTFLFFVTPDEFVLVECRRFSLVVIFQMNLYSFSIINIILVVIFVSIYARHLFVAVESNDCL